VFAEGHSLNWHRASPQVPFLPYNILIRNKPMNYLCLVDGVVEYGSTDLKNFNHYRMMYYEDHKDANVEYLVLTDEEYDAIFLVEDEE
jgi:hypothetical protein